MAYCYYNILYLGAGSGFAGAERYTLTLLRRLASNADINLACGLFYEGPLRERLPAEGIPVVQLCGKRNFKSLLLLIRYIRENGVQLLHFLDMKGSLVGGLASLFVRNTKTVVTVHGLPEFPLSLLGAVRYAVSLCIYRLFLKHLVDRVIFVSDDLACRFGSKIDPAKVRVIHNGVDLPVEASKPRKREPAVPAVVGTVCRLERVKGLQCFLEAGLHLLNMGSDVRFEIIGEGPLEKELKEQARTMGIEERVSFLGFRKDVLPLIEGFDLFVLSSLNEGIPFALLEAMSLSKPVVCTHVGGLREVIRHGVDGLLVPPEDPLALAHAAARLLSDPAYSAQLGRAARARIETEYAAEVMACKTGDIYSFCGRSAATGLKELKTGRRISV